MKVYILFFKCPVPDNHKYLCRIRTPDGIKQPVLCYWCSFCLPLQSSNLQNNVLIDFSWLGQPNYLYLRDMIYISFRILTEFRPVDNLLVLSIWINSVFILRRSVCDWWKRGNHQIQVKHICISCVWISFERRLRGSNYSKSYFSNNVQHLVINLYNQVLFW